MDAERKEMARERKKGTENVLYKIEFRKEAGAKISGTHSKGVNLLEEKKEPSNECRTKLGKI